MNNKNRNKIYGNIFMSLTLTVVLTIFILSTILYANFEKIALSLIYNTSKDNLSQVAYSVDIMTGTAKSLAQQIYHDPKIANLMLFSPQQSEENDALEQMDNYRYTSTLSINSIYVYSKKSDTLYQSNPSSSSVEQDLKSFYDKQIVSILNNIKTYKRFEIIPRSVPLPPGAKGTASQIYNYTFLYYESITGGKPDGAVILNISEEWLHDTMNSLNNNPIQNTFVINEKGIMLTSNKTDNMLTDISKESYIQRILATGAAKGYIVENVRGVKSLVTYVTLDSTDWKFIMVTPYDSIMGPIKKMQFYTLLAGFIILFIGLLASFIMARRIYKPIDKVLERLNSLSREKIESINALKQEYMRNLLQAKIDYDLASAHSKFDQLGIRLHPEGEFLLLVLRIDYFSEFCNKYNSADRRLFKFMIGNMASEISAPYYTNEAVDAGDDHVVIVLSNGTGSPEEWAKELDAVIDTIRETVQKELAISLSITISKQANTIADLPRVYNEAMECSNYRLFLGHGCTIYVKDVLKVHAGEYVYPIGKEELLVNKLMLGKIKDMKDTYIDIMQGAREYSYTAFNIALLRLISTVSATIIKLGKSNDMAFSFNSEAFLKEMSRLETIEEINGKFFNLFDAIATGVGEKRKAKHDDMLHVIEAIIRDEYSDPNLCLNVVADRLGMSPVYLGRLFKTLSTKSVGDHINSYRMEVAKTLLEKTNYSVSEIANRIGILNKSHIYTLFKQEYGITPNEYRQQCGKQDIPE